jgi:hypothetical protein
MSNARGVGELFPSSAVLSSITETRRRWSDTMLGRRMPPVGASRLIVTVG